MARKPNTNKQGGSWTDAQKLSVWRKGKRVNDKSSLTWRKDKCGNEIKWSEYGNRNSNYGWEIDHITAVANGGSDYLSNLQPLHWKNNASKADKRYWRCPN
ncbi:MAG: HNH endonuclease signature motif containing protein [Bacteroidota bacterium]